MNRASAPDLRKALEVAHSLMKAGILFVPMPALNQADHETLVAELRRRMDALEALAEESTSDSEKP